MHDDLSKIVAGGEFDFLDFGCSSGGSLKFGKAVLGGQRGLGIDIDRKKVESAKTAGYDAIIYDINNIPNETLVRFTILSHFLEHVPSRADVHCFIEKACRVSSNFIFIKQPYFDADGYLFQNGFKLFYSDWTGHPNRMTSLELYLILDRYKSAGLIGDFTIHFKKPITSSDDTFVHPIHSPKDQHHYNPEMHPPKRGAFEFKIPIFYEVIAIVSKPGFDHSWILKKFKVDHTVNICG